MNFRYLWGIVISTPAAVFSLYQCWVPINYSPVQDLRKSLNKLDFASNHMIYLARDIGLDSPPTGALVDVRKDFQDYFQKQKVALEGSIVSDYEPYETISHLDKFYSLLSFCPCGGVDFWVYCFDCSFYSLSSFS